MTHGTFVEDRMIAAGTGSLSVPRCGDAGGMTKAGKPCSSPLGLGATGLCLNHDPERQADAKEVHAAGGRAAGAAKRASKAAQDPSNQPPPPPQNLDDAVKFASWLTHAVCVGTIDARSAHEAGYSLNVFKAAVEKRDLQREIAALRAELKAARSEVPSPRLGIARG